MIQNAAFTFLRQHKEVKPEVETLVLKKTRGQVNTESLLEVFENGIAGKYGKIYSLDAATLLGWVDSYQEQKSNSKNYLETGLLYHGEKVTGINYPSTLEGWHKEVNKCFIAYVSGVSESEFHPDCYDRLMLDGKIEFGAVKKYTDGTDEGYKKAKQKAVKDFFGVCRSKGWNQIYYIR